MAIIGVISILSYIIYIYICKFIGVTTYEYLVGVHLVHDNMSTGTYLLSRELAYILTFGTFESMIFLFARWDMLVSWRVVLSLHTVCILYYIYVHMYLFDLLFGDYVVMYVQP